MSETSTEKKKGIGKAALIDVAKTDELRQKGWRVEKLDSGWSAYEVHGDRKVGPATSLAALHTMVIVMIGNKIDLPNEEAAGGSVDTETADRKEVELDSNSKGDRYLPGTAPVVNQQLSDAVLKYHEVKLERVAWTARETASRDELELVAKIHEALFVPDKKKPGTKVYRAGDVICRKKDVVEEKFTTEEAKDDKE